MLHTDLSNQMQMNDSFGCVAQKCRQKDVQFDGAVSLNGALVTA